MSRENTSHRFEQLPSTPEDQVVDGRPSRVDILEFWHDRFGIDQDVFSEYSFWEKGAGTIWIFHGHVGGSLGVEALGLRFLRVRQKHWKPTTNAVQRFGQKATRNMIILSPDEAQRFVRGDTQSIAWDGDWGYLIASREFEGRDVPLGVGLYLHGELQSQIPKARRRELPG